jgi:hypothetical protein
MASLYDFIALLQSCFSRFLLGIMEYKHNNGMTLSPDLELKIVSV